ncbi:MAG: hypothetical protein HC808_07425 [Candidatus Competibacteraceae bacterium]|nr:hypothetical protein [Candidatus Competibacteraceae bacterium]
MINGVSHHDRRRADRIVSQLTLSFILLAVAVAGLTAVYWFVLLQPRLLVAAEANAKLVAQAQAVSLAEVLQPRGDKISMIEVATEMDKTLLVVDPATGKPFIVGLTLELDYETVTANAGMFDLQRGQTACQDCFKIEMSLYSPWTDELLGIAWFYVSPAFFQLLKQDILRTLVVEALLILALLLVVWALGTCSGTPSAT